MFDMVAACALLIFGVGDDLLHWSEQFKVMADESEQAYMQLNDIELQYSFTLNQYVPKRENRAVNDIKIVSQGTLVCELSVPRNAIRSRQLSDPKVVYVDLASGKETTPLDQHFVNGTFIVSPSHFLQLEDAKYGVIAGFESVAVPEGGSRVAWKMARPETGAGVMSMMNVREWYGIGQRHWERLRMYSEVLGAKAPDDIDKRYLEHVKIRENNKEVEWIDPRFDNDDRPAMFVNTIYSKEFSYLPIKEVVSRADGVPISFMAWEYVRQKDIVVPFRYVVRRYNIKSGRIVTDNEFILKDSRVKQRFLDEQFDLTGLGLKKGERLVDKIRNEMYFFDGSQLVDAQTGVASLTPATETKQEERGEAGMVSIRFIIFIANCAILIILIAVLLWKKYGRA